MFDFFFSLEYENLSLSPCSVPQCMYNFALSGFSTPIYPRNWYIEDDSCATEKWYVSVNFKILCCAKKKKKIVYPYFFFHSYFILIEKDSWWIEALFRWAPTTLVGFLTCILHLHASPATFHSTQGPPFNPPLYHVGAGVCSISDGTLRQPDVIIESTSYYVERRLLLVFAGAVNHSVLGV